MGIDGEIRAKLEAAFTPTALDVIDEAISGAARAAGLA